MASGARGPFTIAYMIQQSLTTFNRCAVGCTHQQRDSTAGAVIVDRGCDIDESVERFGRRRRANRFKGLGKSAVARGPPIAAAGAADARPSVRTLRWPPPELPREHQAPRRPL